MDKAGIKHDPRNARRHTPRNLSVIEQSIQRDGFGRSILLANDGTVIAGNATIDAAASAGLDDVIVIETDGTKVVAVKRTDIEPGSEQFHKLALADNRAAELAEWDETVLAELSQEMDLSAFFGDDELNRILATLTKEGKTDPDAVPAVPDEPTTKPGDLWLLGRHRVLCGDSTVATDVERLMGTQRINLCLTDPPYGLEDTKSTKNNYATYDDTVGNLQEIIDGALPMMRAQCDVVVLTPGNRNQWRYPQPTWMMAWFVPAGTGIGPWGFICWQPILCYGSDPKLARGKGSHPDAIVHTESAEKNGHPCPKPIGFWSWLLERTSEPGDSVYDPFLGSGTTLIAAEQLNRTCYGIEIDPHYVDVIVKRWEDFTGQKAVLDAA